MKNQNSPRVLLAEVWLPRDCVPSQRMRPESCSERFSVGARHAVPECGISTRIPRARSSDVLSGWFVLRYEGPVCFAPELAG